MLSDSMLHLSAACSIFSEWLKILFFFCFSALCAPLLLSSHGYLCLGRFIFLRKKENVGYFLALRFSLSETQYFQSVWSGIRTEKRIFIFFFNTTTDPNLAYFHWHRLRSKVYTTFKEQFQNRQKLRTLCIFPILHQCVYVIGIWWLACISNSLRCWKSQVCGVPQPLKNSPWLSSSCIIESIRCDHRFALWKELRL